ncbi:MAG: hypothetical protein ACOYMS_04160 [Terrimicrobiaceae bacterium]
MTLLDLNFSFVLSTGASQGIGSQMARTRLQRPHLGCLGNGTHDFARLCRRDV